AALLALLGRCSSAFGRYQQANKVFLRAQGVLQHVPGADQEKAVIARYIHESGSDETSHDEFLRLHARSKQFCADGELDRANQLCEEELERAARQVGPRDWFTGMLKYLHGNCKAQLVKRVLEEGNEDCIQQAETLLQECQKLFDEA